MAQSRSHGFARAIALAAFVLASSAVAQTPLLKQEPPMGALKPGQIVLVDDGKCPKGQVRQVVGGDHVEAGGTKRVKRTSRCVGR
jgi:hypothetical protein